MFNTAQKYREETVSFDIDTYTEKLKKDCFDTINYKIWKFREEKSLEIKSSYAACNHLMRFLEGCLDD